MAASDARPVPRKNAAFRFYFSLRNLSTGALITTWAGADSEVSLDGAAFADCTNEATEIGTTGCGYIDLTASEMNADAVLYKLTVTNTNAETLVVTFFPEESGDYRADVTLISGDSTAADNAEAFFDGTGYAGTNNVIPTVTTTTTATNVTTVNGLAANVITAASIAADAITDAKVASDVTIASVTGNVGGNVTGSIGSVATGGIAAASFAAGAINAAAIAADAITDAKVASDVTIASVTGAVGSVTGNVGGNVAGSIASIATGGIIAASFGAGAINAAAIATDAIDADALAADAVTEIWAKAMTELTSVPGVTASVLQALTWVFELSRNKITQTATTQIVMRDDATTTLGTSTVSDDGTTFSRGEFA